MNMAFCLFSLLRFLCVGLMVGEWSLTFVCTIVERLRETGLIEQQLGDLKSERSVLLYFINPALIATESAQLLQSS
jgi:hypothetical protein